MYLKLFKKFAKKQVNRSSSTQNFFFVGNTSVVQTDAIDTESTIDDIVFDFAVTQHKLPKPFILDFASTDKSREVLNGVVMDVETSDYCATDGHKLYITNTEMSLDVIIPSTFLKIVYSLHSAKELKLGNIIFNISNDNKTVMFIKGDITISSDTISAQYPNVTSVIPSTGGNKIDITLNSTLPKCKKYIKDEFSTSMICITPSQRVLGQEFILGGERFEKELNTEFITVSSTLDKNIGFDFKNLVPLFKASQATELSFMANAPLGAITTVVDGATLLVMPYRISESTEPWNR